MFAECTVINGISKVLKNDRTIQSAAALDALYGLFGLKGFASVNAGSQGNKAPYTSSVEMFINLKASFLLVLHPDQKARTSFKKILNEVTLFWINSVEDLGSRYLRVSLRQNGKQHLVRILITIHKRSLLPTSEKKLNFACLLDNSTERVFW